MEKLHLAILQIENEYEHHLWEAACRERKDLIKWDVVDITKSDWLERITSKHYDGLLATPSSLTNTLKNKFDERVRILNTVCNIPVYPTMDEIMIYENKKYLSYWLAANRIPHPLTKIFYSEREALDYIEKTPLPLVGKSNVGASGRGVVILKTRQDARNYINNTFSGKGAYINITPKWKKKGFAGRVIRKVFHPSEFRAKLRNYQYQRSEVQKDYVILQEYVSHSFEWRCVRIGDSFFAHKKLLSGEKASGSLLKGYENPPLDLLDFVKEVTDLKNFWSQSVDIFVAKDGRYLVNEMQCIFGQSDPYQMLVDGKPGRYLFIDGEWVFEPGDFNRYESFLLRLDHFIQILLVNKQEKVLG